MYVYFHMKHVAFIIIILKNCIILIQDIVKIDKNHLVFRNSSYFLLNHSSYMS